MIVQQYATEFNDLVARRDWQSLKEFLKEAPAVDVAEMLEDIEPHVAVAIFRLLIKQKAADVFSYLSANKGQELLNIFTTQQLSDVMNNLEPDDRVALLEELPGHLTLRVLSSLKREDREQVQKLLGYPEESVGRLMTTRFVRVKEDWTVEKSLSHIRIYGQQVETLNVIYVVDEKGKLIDDLRLTQLILAEPNAKISEIRDHTFEALSALDDQEEAVRILSKYDRVALPVVDSDGILVGIVTADDVIDVAEEEATEDMHLMAGMHALDDDYSETSLLEMVRKRIGWLVLLFLGQMLTVTALASFEDALAAAAVLAFFVPMIISSGGNSGSQAATLIIRALSTDDIEIGEWKRVFRRELLSGILLGAIIGILGSIVITFWLLLRGETLMLSTIMQAVTVGASLLGVVVFGNLSGSMLPFIMSRLGLDPAVTSAPLVATLVDVTGILIYFSMAALLLKGVVL
jgi:magnesium transporter